MATTNILIETFSGLGLPSTLSLPLPSTSSISNVFFSLDAYLPPVTTPLRLTTAKGVILSPTSKSPLSSLLGDLTNDFLTLRLTAPLPGGKGGFGSQLRAAGGRMSSRKRKGQENSDSCRNLDGRRLRTVKEAKALAQYLETKPDMDKKEREKRKERWEKVIEAADEKIRGGGNVNQRFDDAKWLEEKDEGRDKAREAVLRAMKANAAVARVPSSSGQSSSSEDLEGDDNEEEEENNNAEESSKSSEDEKVMEAPRKVKAQPKKIFGFDEDDDFLSSDEEEEVSGKGKGRA